MERKFLFFPFLGIFQSTFAWNEAIVVFFNFLNFFSHFFEIFYNAVELERNGMIIFIFPLSKPFPTYFCLKVGHNGISLFFAIFLEFYITRRMGTKRNDNFLFSIFFILFLPILACTEATTIFFNFFNFLAVLLEFSITCRAGTEGNDNFYFLAFPYFSNLFSFKMNP